MFYYSFGSSSYRQNLIFVNFRCLFSKVFRCFSKVLRRVCSMRFLFSCSDIYFIRCLSKVFRRVCSMRFLFLLRYYFIRCLSKVFRRVCSMRFLFSCSDIYFIRCFSPRFSAVSVVCGFSSPAPISTLSAASPRFSAVSVICGSLPCSNTYFIVLPFFNPFFDFIHVVCHCYMSEQQILRICNDLMGFVGILSNSGL